MKNKEEKTNFIDDDFMEYGGIKQKAMSSELGEPGISFSFLISYIS